MKKNLSKIMLIAFAGIAMLGMTSCNADEPENDLTPAEAQAAYESVKGEYTGYVFFNKRKNNSHELEKDSLPVSVSLNSGTMLTIKNLPTKAIAGILENGNLKKAIEEAGAIDLKCNIGFMRKDPVTMLVNPLPATFKINYNGKEQEIKTLFLINSKSSAAQAVGKDKLAMQIIQMAGMYLGEQRVAIETGNTPLLFKLKR